MKTICGAILAVAMRRLLPRQARPIQGNRGIDEAAIGLNAIFSYASVIFTGVGMGALADRFGSWDVPILCVSGLPRPLAHSAKQLRRQRMTTHVASGRYRREEPHHLPPAPCEIEGCLRDATASSTSAK